MKYDALIQSGKVTARLEEDYSLLINPHTGKHDIMGFTLKVMMNGKYVMQPIGREQEANGFNAEKLVEELIERLLAGEGQPIL